MLTTYPHLLPKTSTPYEMALAGPTGRLTDIPVPLRDLWRWDTCPEEHLPWLAWAMSVDLWNEAWPVEKKRNLIRESFELHRHKGTLHTISRYLDYADAPLRRAIVPPDKAFPGRSMTTEERAAWLARFPQIRIFQYRDRGEATFGAFCTGAFKLEKSFLGAGPSHAPPATGTATAGTFFPYKTDAWERYGRRAFLWDKGQHYLATGIEMQLRWLERTRQENVETVYDGEQILIPGSQVQSLFCGAMAKGNQNKLNGRRFCINSTARSRIVTTYLRREQRTLEDVLIPNTTRPSLDTIQAFPEQVAERGTSQRGQSIFCGMPGRWLDLETKQRKVVKSFMQGFLPETTAPLRLYDRLHLHDQNRLPEQRPVSTHMGQFRLGMPAYHAQLTVEIKGERSRFQLGQYMTGHLMASDQAPLKLARTAVVRGKAWRDKGLLKTQIHRVIRASDGVRASAGHRSGGLIAAY